MGYVKLLDTQLSNMIAAGEVIERIGNVVKELVENSIDALATQIDITLKEAGFSGIVVSDNGTGMDQEDAVVAFERHATSKISSVHDLFHLHSLGFRGEALPSIAAVSNISVTTSMGGETGRYVEFQAGKLIKNTLGPARKGTVVSVTKLFFNTPARLKYLKSPAAELSNIAELVDKFALSHPEIRFSLTNDGKKLVSTFGNSSLSDVVFSLYGTEAAKNLLAFDGSNRDYQIEGLFCNPIVNRASRGYVTVITNGRVVRNGRIFQQLMETFEQLIPKHRYPIVVLRINADAGLIDVNVHPTKLEVKFSEEAGLLHLIDETIKQVLHGILLYQSVDHPDHDGDSTQEKMSFIHETIPLPNNDQSTKETSSIKDDVSNTIASRLPNLHYIGQLHGTYLLFQNEEGMYLVDQHAAAERIRYERYLSKMSQPKPGIYDLLVPFLLEFTVNETLLIEPHLTELNEFGLDLESAGPRSFHLRSVPEWFPQGFETLYAEEVIRLVIEGKRLNVADIRNEIAILLACKHSIKANHFIDHIEVDAILTDLGRCNNPFTCPHGRPIFVKITLQDIEKWFKRVV